VHEFRPEMGRLPNVILGNHTIAQNRLAMIDIMQKKVERGDSLFQTALDFLPNPKARGMRAEEFMDTSLMEEIKNSGFIDRLYAKPS